MDPLWNLQAPIRAAAPWPAPEAVLSSEFVVKLLDRYVVRETLTPFLLALGLFTFLLAVRPMLEQAQKLLAKGVDLPTTGFLLLTLLPQALGVTIPMAFLTGVLMALGRLSGDREAVAMLACGVSPQRLLRPIVLLAVLVGGMDLYCMVRLIPDSNQRFRIETFKLLTSHAEADIKPGVFYEGFPGKILFVKDTTPGAGWTGVMLADVSKPGRPVITLAPQGYLEIDASRQQVTIVLPGESVRYSPGQEEGVYDVARDRDLHFAVPASTVFGDGNISRGLPEMSIPQLREAEAQRVKDHLSPHREIMQRHQMFSFPVACVVFAVLGLALGLHTRREGKLGGLTMGLAVIAVYDAAMALAEAQTKGGHFPAEWARWVPNIVLAIMGALALWWRARAHGSELAITLPGIFRKLWPRRTPAEPATATGVAPRPADRVVLVIRIPQIHLPRPRLLDTYVAGKYLRMLALSCAGLLTLYYIGTFIDKAEKLAKGQADSWMLLEYFYYSTPQFVVYVVPMAILVSVLATIGGLTRTGELVVMRSCGVSLYRAAAPLLVFALVWSGALFFLDDRVLAQANRRAQALDTEIRSGTAPTITAVAGSNWLADARGRIYFYTAYDQSRATLHGLSVFEVEPATFRLTRHIEATKVRFEKNAWRAEHGWMQTFKAADRSVRESFTNRTVQLAPPRQFEALRQSDVELMTYGQLLKHLNESSGSGVNLTETRVDLHSRIAFPLVTVIMTVLAVPFGVTTGKRGALYGIGLAMMLAAAYWLVNTFFTAAGDAALLPPALGAWAANLLFFAAALYATFTVRT